jgi:type I restriction enzyme R subunit
MDKETFQIFDFCQNFEFFGQNPELTEATPAPSVRERRFLSRLDLLRSLRAQGAADPAHHELGTAVADLLWREVDGMTTVNFAVRPHRRTVERFGQRNEWITATIDDLDGARALAGLPSTKAPEDVDTEEAKRFDVLLLQLQLALLQADPSFLPLRKRVVEIASLIEEYPTIPAVKAQLGLIAGSRPTSGGRITLPSSNRCRRLRTLVGFIEKRKRKPVYTDFADELGAPVEIAFGAFTPASDFERFRRKAGAFLRDHRGETAVKKIHQNWPITPADLAELQRILVDSGVGSPADVDRAAAEAGGFRLFVPLTRGAGPSGAKDAFAPVTGSTWAVPRSVHQPGDRRLTQQGVVEPARYESPFTDLSPQGPKLFAEADIDRMVEILDQVRAGAATA